MDESTDTDLLLFRSEELCRESVKLKEALATNAEVQEELRRQSQSLVDESEKILSECQVNSLLAKL